MCLYVDQEKTAKAKKNKTGKVIRWKVIEMRGGSRLESIYNFYGWKPGWNKSNRETKKTTPDENWSVDYGIHIFTNRQKARISVVGYRFRRIIKVICYYKDLVAVGSRDDEVYTKVFVPKDEYDSAMSRTSIERR